MNLCLLESAKFILRIKQASPRDSNGDGVSRVWYLIYIQEIIIV